MKEKSDILVNFGVRLRAIRLSRSLSQEELGARCGLDRTYISGIERGTRNLSLINISLIANALGVSVSELTREM